MEEIIQSLKEMQIYTNIENADVEQILTNIPDNECGVWRKLIQGQKTLTEEQIRDSFEDLTRPIVKLEEDAKKTSEVGSDPRGCAEKESRKYQAKG